MKKRFETLKKAFHQATRTLRGRKKAAPVDEGRRKFLKILALGGGVFVAGKVMSNFVEYFASDPASTLYFKNFKITESKREIGVYDSSGDQILIIDKED